jgi:hypothetical protein
MICNGAQPWGHYNPPPLIFSLSSMQLTLSLQVFQNFQKDAGTLPALLLHSPMSHPQDHTKSIRPLEALYLHSGSYHPLGYQYYLGEAIVH